ncbi:MAG: hypothetical protein KAS64_08965 [Spirochaetes bacterium]|nr:hypothetical protein [Spirochaetota bacterium]
MKKLITFLFILLSLSVFLICGKNTNTILKNKKRLFKNIPKDGRTIYYLNKKYDRLKFHAVKKKETLELKKRLKLEYKLNFKVRYTKYFNIAYRCHKDKIKHLQYFLAEFFKQVYPRYFIYEPAFPFNVVYFRNSVEFASITGNRSYGHYKPSKKTLYTYAGSGHGTLWHELIHAFVDANIDNDPQQWFNEGFASFYEMAFLYGGKVVEGYANWRMPNLKRAIQLKLFQPVKTFVMNKYMHEIFGYSTSRFLFCYLWVNRVMEPFVKSYLYDLSSKYQGKELGKMVIKKLETLTGKSIDQINKEYLEMVKKTRRNQKLHQKKR